MDVYTNKEMLIDEIQNSMFHYNISCIIDC